MDINEFLSDNARNMKPSPIRALLNVVNQPGIISFAGGFPNPLSFPVEEIKQIMNEVLDEEGVKALQYGGTDGNAKLREEISKRYIKQGLDIDKDNIIITTASQQAIDLTARIFVNPGDTVVCGLPSYLGALQAFNSYRANIVGAEKDEELEAVVRAMCMSGKKPKFIYAIPDFQNPSGLTMTVEQRQYMVKIARKYDLLIVEDSPYREIRFEGEHQPLIATMAPERTIVLGTFSKTFVPGFRLGWVIAPKEIVYRYNLAKQSADLCSPVFDQYVAAKYLEKGYFEKNLEKTIEMYRGKRDVMLASLEKYMPEGVTWTKPDGGLFLFITLPEGYDATELFHMALEQNVAFVIGEAFFCDGTGKNTLRVNFSFMDDAGIEEGIKRLAAAVRTLFEKNEK
ncbi:MAG: PLP-dependent aminotransferase family protein [Bacteroidales bacterium]|nr:PLP-dependent aminotransferase family protein [Bacteroidales bacterium]MBQ8035033.1 PLP-dependent aminotransferase family protein [Bacteroidales bacterium]